MGDLSRNFSRKEFACKGQGCCGHSAPVSLVLVEGLQALRDLAGVTLVVSSGFRCRTHNERVGGAADSQHTLGLAADVPCPKELAMERFLAMAESIPCFARGGIGVYSGWLHLDVRNTGKARWRG